jgi:hypothetical protein
MFKKIATAAALTLAATTSQADAPDVPNMLDFNPFMSVGGFMAIFDHTSQSEFGVESICAKNHTDSLDEVSYSCIADGVRKAHVRYNVEQTDEKLITFLSMDCGMFELCEQKVDGKLLGSMAYGIQTSVDFKGFEINIERSNDDQVMFQKVSLDGTSSQMIVLGVDSDDDFLVRWLRIEK